MPLSPAFTVSQSAIQPETVVVTDSSTGSDVLITQRRVYISTATGAYLTGNGTVNYTAWPLADTSITLSILTQDTAANIKVEWLGASDNVLYSDNNNYPLSEFGKQFFYYLSQLQAQTPGIYQDTNYASNLSLFWTNIVAGDNAVNNGNDIAAAQNCYNREIYMMNNQSDFF